MAITSTHQQPGPRPAARQSSKGGRMSPNQFAQLMDRFDKFEDRFAARLLRVEVQIAALGGGITLAAVLLGAGVINI